MRVAPRTLKLLPWPFICLISSDQKKAKEQKATESRADNVPRCCCCSCCYWHKCLTSCFAWREPNSSSRPKGASPVARSDPGGSSNNNMWLMWEKTSRMRVEMLHASPSPRRQLRLLQLHLHFQLQFCKSYAKTAEGRARSALATWLWLFFLASLILPTLLWARNNSHFAVNGGGKQEMEEGDSSRLAP